MKIYKFLLVTVTSFLFFLSQSVFAVYGLDDVANDISEKTTTYGSEIEVNEFVLLDAMPDIELYYYPYSADDADPDNTEDVPGGAGSVYVSGGIIKWHTNIDTTISIDDLTFTHIDTAVTERNEIETDGVGINIGTMSIGETAVAAATFSYANGATISEMSSDMVLSYSYRNYDGSSANYTGLEGHTDFAAKFHLALQLASDGDVQGPGIYRATATVRAMPSVST